MKDVSSPPAQPPQAQTLCAPSPAPALRASVAFLTVAGAYAASLHLWRADLLPSSTLLLGLAPFAAALAIPLTRSACAVALVLCLALLSSAYFSFRVLEPTPGTLALRDDPDNPAILTIEGDVLARPELAKLPAGALAEFSFDEPRTRVELALRAVVAASGARPLSGRVDLSVASGLPLPLRPGDRLRATGLLLQPEPPSNPGQSDPRLWAAMERHAGVLIVSSPDLIHRLDDSRAPLARANQARLRALQWLRDRAQHALALTDPSPSRALLAALLLGRDEQGADDIRQTFARQGLAHILAISGFHLVVMAGAALVAVRLTGDRGRAEPAIVALLVLLYLLVLPALAPIIRSGVMVLALLAAESLGRRHDRRAVLAWTGVALLLWRPMDAFALGFQLTFGVTGALLWLAPRAHHRLFPPSLRFDRYEPPDILHPRWWGDALARLLSSSLLCWAAAAPLIAMRTGIFSPYAVLSTLIVTPLCTVLLWAGFAAMALGAIVPPLGHAAVPLLDSLARLMLAIVQAAELIPLSHVRLPVISPPLTLAATITALWWITSRVNPRLLAVTILVLAQGAAEITLHPRHAFALRIDTLDVSDGTCHLVRGPDGAFLWDCGSLRPDLGLRAIPTALRTLDAPQVPVAIISHANFDHFSALLDAAEPISLERVIVGEGFLDRAAGDPDGAAASLLGALRARGIDITTVRAGDRLSLAGLDVEFLSPRAGDSLPSDNDRSLVARVTANTREGPRDALLTGDIQRAAMATLLRPDLDLRAHILELPHHGSFHPLAVEFVRAVDPEVVMQSTGPTRAREIAWNEARAGRDWLVTAADAWCWVEVGQDGSITTGSGRRP